MKLRKKEDANLSGIVAFVVTIMLTILGIVLPPSGIIFGTNPFHLLAKCRYPNLQEKWYMAYVMQKVVTYLIIQWCALESSRVYIAILTPVVVLCNIYLGCLNQILTKPLNDTTLHMYNILYCINQLGIDIIRIAGGALMFFGFWILVLCNCIVLKGWGMFPVEIYVGFVSFLLMIYFALSQTVPLAIRSNELSKELLHCWKNMLVKTSRKRYWSKVVCSKMPVSFYYMMTKFETETKANYYSSIVDNTISYLLVINN